jgi:hypothetical protein
MHVKVGDGPRSRDGQRDNSNEQNASEGQHGLHFLRSLACYRFAFSDFQRDLGGYGWSPQTYACAVKRGDQEWLNFVNTALHEAMTGVEFNAYAASFKKWFGVDLPPPSIGFPVEFK